MWQRGHIKNLIFQGGNGHQRIAKAPPQRIAGTSIARILA